MRTLLLAAAAVLAVTAAPTSASAATPIDLGPGRAASVVVDTAGTAHILFRSLDVAGAPHGATYCRLPRNAAACDVRTFTPLPEQPSAVRILRRAGDGALIALMSDTAARDGVAGGLYASYSFDGGATFSPLALIATGQRGAPPVGLTPDGQAVISLIGDPGGLFLWRSPFSGPDPRVLAVDDRVSQVADSPAMVVLSNGRMLVADESDEGVAWRVFAGGDPLDINAWPVRGTLRGQDAPVLATGPRGVFLLDDRGTSDELLDRQAPFGLRSFDTRRLRWRSSRSAGADQSGLSAADIPGHSASDLAQDASGRLHLVSSSGNSAVGECVQYTRTGTRSSQWFGRTTTLFHTRTRALQPEAPKVAAAPDGRGVAVWHTRTGETGAEGNVYVTPLRQARGRYRPVGNPFRRPICGRRG